VARLSGKHNTLIRAWLHKYWAAAGPASGVADTLPLKITASAVPVKYRALNKYLTERYADAVTLTFGQIEDVLGSALPAQARTQHDWWTTSVQGGESLPSAAWMLAGRTALPNLGAQIVLFERRSSP
jgi:hypothetical protein